MILLDFYGMPGSGKSTVSHLLAQELRKKDFLVLEPSWELDNHSHPLKRKFKKVTLTLLFSLTHSVKICRILRCSGNIGKSFGHICKQWINVAYTLYYANKTCNVDYMIMDEGIYQAVVSLHAESNIPNYMATLKMLLEQIDTNIVPVCVIITVEEALMRLEKRATKNSRVDQLDGTDKIQMLMQIENIIKEMGDQGIFVYNEGVDVNLIVGKIMNELNCL